MEQGSSNTKRGTLLKLLRQGGSGRELNECKELDDWIAERRFTFVVGPGCARLGWSEPDVTRPVAVAMVRVFQRLPEADDRTFFARMAAKCSMDLTLDVEGAETSEVEEALRAPRCNLVRLARIATALFTAGLSPWTDPIVDWEAVAVPLPPASRKIMVNALREAKAQLDALNEMTRGQRQVLADGPATPSRRDWDDVRDLFGIEAIAQSLDVLGTGLDQGDALTGEQVEWLTHLVWHAFRYAAPWPPSTDEIAFQLGVTGFTEPLMQLPDRAQAAQLRNSQTDAVESLRRIYDIADRSATLPGWENRSRLFTAIAKLALRPQLRRMRSDTAGSNGRTTHENEQTKANPFYALNARPGRGDATQPPIVLSSSFDRLLEAAFEVELKLLHAKDPRPDGLHLSFHLLVPMLKSESARQTGEIRWVVGTFWPVDDRWTWRYVVDESQLPLEGPTIVKLNGDPHLKLGIDDVEGFPTDEDDESAQLQPLAVLTEFQHLSVLMAENLLFEGLVGRGLPSNGRFILLAESVGEWSIRQRLFGQTMRSVWQAVGPAAAPEAGEAGLVEAISINRRSDSLRHSLFGWVNIREYRGELADVVTRLESKTEMEGVS